MNVKTAMGRLIRFGAITLLVASFGIITVHAETLDEAVEVTESSVAVETENGINSDLMDEDVFIPTNTADNELIIDGQNVPDDGRIVSDISNEVVFSVDTVVNSAEDSAENSISEQIEEPALNNAANSAEDPVEEPAEETVRNGFYQEPLSDGRTVWVYYVNGVKATNQRYINGYWYMFLPETGEMVTGFYNHTAQTNPAGGAKTCYYDTQGHMVYNQRYIDGYWYMFAPGSGAMVRGFYNHTAQTNPAGGAKTCYYDANGHMVYNQRYIDGYWYMFAPGSGAMVRGFYNHTAQTNPTGGAKTCYYDAQGHMVYNQRCIDGYWYMFAPGSGAMVRGFYNHTAQTNPAGGAKTCYYDANGHMLYGQHTIDGTIYVFDSGSGALISSKPDPRVQYPQACAVLDQIGWDLHAALNWAASCRYVTMATSGSSREFADFTFKNSAGNCYGMAAAFYEMACALGYDAHQMAGYVPLARGGLGPHSWVEVVIDGTTYICDPDFQHETGRNGYLIHYGQSGTWRYSNYSRMN